MTDLLLPEDGPRVGPLRRNQVNAYVLTEYEKSIHTWGIPNNLIRTMACLPRLGLTEVDYANSFIFDREEYALWPNPADNSREVLFPMAGFVDRVTKELLINLVSLLNKSRYSITHHTVIGLNTISPVHGVRKAEQMLLHLVDEEGNADFEYRSDLYGAYHLAAMKVALKLLGDAHDVSDEDFSTLRSLCEERAREQIAESAVLGAQEESKSQEYVSAYVNGMLVEMTWCIVHFGGLLNKWFTVMKVVDESDEERDGIDFVSVYNSMVPESIKQRNNALLGPDGWGGNA